MSRVAQGGGSRTETGTRAMGSLVGLGVFSCCPFALPTKHGRGDLSTKPKPRSISHSAQA